jgi:hypothetical protein
VQCVIPFPSHTPNGSFAFRISHIHSDILDPIPLGFVQKCVLLEVSVRCTISTLCTERADVPGLEFAGTIVRGVPRAKLRDLGQDSHKFKSLTNKKECQERYSPRVFRISKRQA